MDSASSNRLINSTSPYLLQHAHNPVDWYCWSEEAFQKALAENKPVFLSIGYSACHWCHVMERESFENHEVAEILNRLFVSIKVDREERPDIDEIYMTATQLLTGSGGWPNSLFLTPDRKPFHAGTYFPPDDRWGRPGFKRILVQLAEAFRMRRDEIDARATEIVEAMRKSSAGISGGPLMEMISTEAVRAVISSALDDLRSSFDRHDGGFGSAPKFPPHGALELLLHEYSRTPEKDLLDMVTGTLDAMAWGGIHDQIGGGFARYSTDDQWLLPHFEKMLYDNAQLSMIYVSAFLATGNVEYRRVAEGVFEWVLREMTDKDGAFFSALDADSEGEEGKFYLWTKSEILDVLGREEGEFICDIFNVTERGNFIDEQASLPHVGTYDGRNILHIKHRAQDHSGSDAPAGESKLDAVDYRRIDRAALELRRRRDARIRPGLDDKILTAWNGLMIESLAFAGRVLNVPRYTEAAERAAEFIIDRMTTPDDPVHGVPESRRLLATARHGKAHLAACLDDYVFFAGGLIELHRATGSERYKTEAANLMRTVLHHFSDPDAAGFFFTSDDHEKLLYRWKDAFDKAIPSGNGRAAQVLFKLYELTLDHKYQKAATETLQAFYPMMQRAARGMHSMLLAAARFVATQPFQACGPEGCALPQSPPPKR